MKKQPVKTPKANSVEPFWRKHTGFLLAVFAFILYANTISNGYNLDDELVTIKHKLTSKGIKAIPEIFSSPYYSDDVGYAYEYRPTVLTSFAIERSLLGESPGKSHFINVLLYALLIMLIYKVLKELLQAYSFWIPVISTLLFAAHPLHTEVVASIKNRDEILALLGAFGAWLMLYKFVEKQKHWLLIPTIIFFTLGLLSKMSIAPMAILIPLSLVYFKEKIPNLVVSFATITLLLPSFLLSPIHNPLGSLPLFIAISLLPVLLNNSAAIYAFMKQKSLAIKDEFIAAKPNLLLINEEFDFQFQWKLNIKEYCTTFSIIGIVSSLLSFYGMHYFSRNQAEVFLIQTIVVFLIYTYGSIQEKNIAIFLFSVVFAYFSIFAYFHSELAMGLLFVVYFFFFRKGFQNLLLLFSILIIVLTYLFDDLNYQFIGLILLMLSIKYSSKIKYLSIGSFILLILMVTSDWDIIFGFLSKGDVLLKHWLIVISIIALFVLVSVNRIRQYFPIVFVFLFTLNSVLLIEHKPEPKKNLTETVPTQKVLHPDSIKVSKAISPAITFSTDRPINYIEMPVNYTSPLTERLGLSAAVLGFYLQKSIIPYPLGYYYGFAYFKPESIFKPFPMFFLVIYLLIFALVLLLYRKQKIMSFSLLFFLASIILFSGLLYPVVGIAADRFAFLSTIGFCLFLTKLIFFIIIGGVPDVNVVKIKPSFFVISTIILCLYSVLTISRNKDWKDQLTLMRHDIQYLDQSAQAHNLLAINIMKSSFGQDGSVNSMSVNEAIVHFKKALSIYPAYFNVTYDIGRSYLAVNEIDSAFTYFSKTHKMDSTLTDATFNLALISEQKGRASDAIKLYEQILSIEPGNKVVYGNLSYLYFKLNNPIKSIETNKRAIQYNPNWTEPYENIARVYYSQNDSVNALLYLNKQPKNN